jgi:exodeoxyribonuclease VIII
VIADLKTTEDASERAWIRDVVKYQYHAQAAFYLDGLETLEPRADRQFLWIAVEKKPPFACAIYQPDDATIYKGRAMYRNYLRQWLKCTETGEWPGYDVGIQPLLLPDWALRSEAGEDGE